MATGLIPAVSHALYMAFAMGWEILWPLILGFALSAVIQAVVSQREMSRLLPDDSPRSLGVALALGAASSSCSYAAVAIARSIFRKGAHFTAAMAFEIASTNLVFELSIILVVLMGWQFMITEAIAAPIMVAILALLFRKFLRPELIREAREQADRGIAGRMEGHAEMDMSVPAEGSLIHRITSDRGLTAISHYFVYGLGVRVDGYSRRSPHRWRNSRLGSIRFLAGLFPERSPNPGNALGTDRRAAGRDRFLRVFGRKYPARGGLVERRNQFWRRARFHPG
jgi:uncharacterized membrane protein YraQ (UPF0718 family)